jgi:7-carboxy-7-deazaguanine synthase (Cx14CxxC type)
LWSGREQDRAAATCQFCDTRFVGTDGDGGGKFETPEALASAASKLWPGGGAPYVVCTGGEPLLQLDAPLIEALHRVGFEIAIETNGTLAAPRGIDWICVSPKANAEFVQRSGDELKLVFPQAGAEPERYAGLAFSNFFLQPMDNPQRAANTQAAAAYCMGHPQWRLSLQVHKLLGLR